MKAVIRMWFSSLYDLLLLLPLFLLVDVYLIPSDSMGWMAWLPLLALLGGMMSLRLPYVWSRWLSALVLGGLFAAAALGADWRAVLLLPVGMGAVLIGFRAGSGGSSPSLAWFGVTGYLLAAFFFRFWPELQVTLPLLTWAGAFGLILVVYNANSRFLQHASLSKNGAASVPAAIRTHNRLYVGGVLVTAFVLAASAGSYMGQLLLSVLRTVVRWLLGEDRQEPERIPEQPAAPNPLQGLPQEEPGLLTFILNLLFYVITAIVLLLITGYVLYWLYRHGGEKIKGFLQRIMIMLRREVPVEKQQGYVDEESGVFSWETARRRMRDFWRDKLYPGAKEKWEEQKTNRDRVRYLYREWLRLGTAHGYERKEHLTPKETGAELLRKEAADRRKRKSGPNEETASLLLKLYYRVRYGGRDVTDEEVERIRQWK